MRKLFVGAILGFTACSLPIMREGGGGGGGGGDPSSPDATAATGDGANGSDGSGTALDAGPATCNGYEPCGINPVMAPAGYTLRAGVNYDSYGGIYGTCTDWADCGMWNIHYTSNWLDPNGNPVNPYYNRMASPFPWSLSRYEIDVDPGKVEYAKLHMSAVGDTYEFADGTKEMQTDRDTGVTTCFQRGASPIKTLMLGNLGGTGNTGAIDWNISILPGDMGNTGNVSTCQGNADTSSLYITSDEGLAIAHPTYCLLREGHDYYVNFTSHGHVNPHFDCSQTTCAMGGFLVINIMTEDGSPALDPVPCN